MLVVDSDVGTPAREKKESRKKSDKPAGEVSHKKRRGQFKFTLLEIAKCNSLLLFVQLVKLACIM